MKNLHDYRTWVQINEQESSSLLDKFSNMAKSVGSSISSSFDSIINSYKKKFRSQNIDRVLLCFPLKGWETVAVNILKSFGVVTGVFKSVEEAIQTVKALKNKGFKTKEIVIGSHGDGKTLLITKKEDSGAKRFEPDLLKNVKDIITKDSVVFFTACHGADYLTNLVDAANNLGVGTYGSRGLYNYVTNSSEEGYYYCKPYQIPKPKKVTEPRDEFYSGKLEMKISGIGEDKDSILFEFIGSFGETPKLKIEFKPSSFSYFGWQTKYKEPLSFILSKEKIGHSEKDYGTKDAEKIYSYSFYINTSDFGYDRGLDEIGFTELSNLLKEKKWKWSSSKNKNFATKLKKSIENGDVKLSIGDVDLSKERPKMRGYRIDEVTFDNNEHLLECGACKKVKEVPIKWIGSISNLKGLS